MGLDAVLNVSGALGFDQRATKLLDAIKAESSFDVDPNRNLTFLVSARHYLAARLCESNGGITAPEILGLWMKEGGDPRWPTRWPTPLVVRELINLAATRFREDWYYLSLGLDDYCLIEGTSGDNRLILDTAKALINFENKAGKVTAVAILAELVVPSPASQPASQPASKPASQPASQPVEVEVRAKPWFVVRSMLLASARWRRTVVADPRFQDIRVRYMQWNMKAKSFADFLTSAVDHATREIGIEDPVLWAFHTAIDPRLEEFNQVRRNAIRFWAFRNVMRWRLDVFEMELVEGRYKQEQENFRTDTPFKD